MATARQSRGGASPPSGGVPEAQLIIDLTETDLGRDVPVYVYVVGLIGTSNTFYYLDNNFMPQVMNVADNTIAANTFPGMSGLSPAAQAAIAPNYPDAWADWSLAVSVGQSLILPLGNISTTNIATLGTGKAAFSGRVYFSIGIPKLPFSVTATGYTAPVYGLGSGVPGSLTIYDWIEFSYDSEGNFNGNTTQVNQFGFPILLTGTPVGGSSYPTQGRLGTSRTDILNAFAGGSAPFGTMMLSVPGAAAAAYPKNTNYFRALSPVTVSGFGTSLDTYFDADLATAYAAWQTTPLVTTDQGTGSYSGVVFPLTNYPTIATPGGYPAGSLAFYSGSYTSMATLAMALQSQNPPAPVFYLTGSGSNTVTSNDIWQCANSLNAGSAAQQNVGKMVGAAFNRGMVVDGGVVTTSLDDTTCSEQAGSFYSAGTTFNPWSQAWHDYNRNGLAYGFPYDDVCEQSTDIPPPGTSLVASFIRMTLGKFHG